MKFVGLMVVANFQEAPSPWPQVYYAHLIGALTTFPAGIICAILQAWLTHLMHPEIVEMSHFWWRSLIALLGILFFAGGVTTGVLAHVDRQSKIVSN
jgi:cell shape-determining protein MreD